MRRCRKMISVIMLMVMLVSLLPTGAMAAEAPTGATNEVAAVEEPTEVEPATGKTEETLPAETKTDGTENEGDNETTITEGTSEGASVSDGTEATGEATDGGTNEAASVGEPSNGENSSEAATDAAGIGMTSYEIAPVVEPVEKEAKAAGDTVLLKDYLDSNYNPPIVIRHRKNADSEWEDYDEVSSPLKDTDDAEIYVYFMFPKGVINKDCRDAYYELPQPIVIIDELRTGVYNSSKERVGNMRITTDGKVYIQFDEEFANGDPIEGYFFFDSKITGEVVIEDNGKFSFDGVGKPFIIDISDIKTSDVSVSKTNSGLTFDNGVYKTSYTITVGTLRGTKDTITVTDTITKTDSGVYNYAYNNLKVQFVAVDGTKTPVSSSSYSLSKDGVNWTISGLPKLAKGEKYLITYDSQIEQLIKNFTLENHSKNTGTTIKNSVKATSDKDSSETKNELVIQPELKKSKAVYSEGRGLYTWTVQINKNKHDITGYTYTDKMTDNLVTVTDVTIKSDVTGKKVTITADKINEAKGFSHTFTTDVWGAKALKGSFTITYRTSSSPSDEDHINTGILTGGSLTYRDQEKVPGPTPMKTVKVKDGVISDDWKTYTLTMHWGLREIQLPAAMKAGDSVTYEDTLGVLLKGLDKNGKQATAFNDEVSTEPVEGTVHYTYCKNVYNALNGAIWITTSDGYYKFSTDFSTNCGFSQTTSSSSFVQSNGFSFELIGFDANGNSYNIVDNKNDATTEIVKFQVKIKANKDVSISNATMGVGLRFYTSYLRYGKDNYMIVNGGGVIRVKNTIQAIGHADWTAEESFRWALGADMAKSGAVVLGDDGNWYIDYTVKLHYDLLNIGYPVTITDQRSFDATKYYGGVGEYVDGSATVELYQYWDSTAPTVGAETMKNYFTVDASQDGTGKLLFNFDFTKKKTWDKYVRLVLIKYRVRIDEDEYWDDPRSNLKVYKNEVSDEYEHKVAAETTVETSHRILEKTGTQLTDETEYTNTVLFDVEINPSGADLDPTSDTVKLVDTLTDDTEVSSFSYDSIQLYEYDKDAEDHKGSPISKDDWISNYDPKTKTLTVIVDDEKAYVLSYVYTVKKDKIREGKTEISNKAELNGKWHTEKHIPIHEIKAGVIVDKRDITITKVDKDREAKTLSGAKFKLEKYDSEAKEWVFVDDYTTNEKSGSFVLYGTEMDSDVPYRLTETEAPAGYSNKDLSGNDITFYFVIKSKDETAEAAAANAGLASMTPSASAYTFFDYYGGTAAIKDQQIGSLSVSKTVENGSANDNSKDFSFTVTLSNKTISGKYGDMTFDKGVAKFSLKHGQTKTASGLPTGIKYTVTETAATGYSTKQTGATGTITTKKSEAKFTNTPDTVKVDVTKVWVDGENAGNTRPASVTIKLLANGKDTGKTLELNAKNEWKGSFDGLQKNDADGAITYTIEENSVKNYAVAITGNAANGFTVTNTLKTDITVKKVWNDANNQDRKRPTSISVFLTKDGNQVGSPIILDGEVDKTETTAWEYTWTNLDKYSSDGKLINYGVDEDDKNMPIGYSKSVTSEGTVYTITNTYAPGKVNAQVTKVWDDADNQDGLRKPVEVQLMKNGESMGDAYKATLTKDNWTKTWTGLDEKKDGVQIKYTVVENTKLAGYKDPKIESVYNAKTKTWEISVENKHTPATTKVNVLKVWDDNNDQDGKRPASINVYLTKDGTKDESTKQTLNEANGWTYTWDNLPVNKKEGQGITYSVTEDVIEDYNIDDKTREPKAAVAVKVKEETDPKTGIKTVFYSLTNTHGPDKTKVYVEKEWDDKGDQDGKRPAKIIVKLIDSDDPETVIQSAELSEAKGWSYTFTNLPKYKKTAAGSVEITYDVTETVEGTDSLDGYNLTKTTIPADKLPEGVEGVGFAYHLKNTYSPEKRNISVLKVWDDANNMDKRQPVEITVQLYADGASFGDPVTLRKSEGWTYTWEGLDKNRDEGVEIQYTVDEVEVPDGYEKVSIEGGMTTGYIITNKHDKRPVSISKVDITNSKEVAGATLQILDNGKVVTAKDEEGNDFECTWTSTTEPKVIYGLTPGTVYTLHEEVQPDGYTIAADTTFTVDANGVVTSSGTVTNNVVLVEDAPTKVNVRKVDIANDKELPGATLQIIDSKNVVFKEWTSTEEDYVVTNLIAGEEYTLVETVAPLGFTVTSKTTFTVDNNNKVTSTGATTTLKDGTPVLLVKDTMTVVKISKTDITGDKELKGATLQILDESENVVTVKDHDGNDVKCEWVSTDKPHVVEGLEINKTYTLREKTAPDGFTITTDATFSIDENNRITTEIPRNSAGVLLVKDKPTKVKVSKVDITGEKELQGATLQILDSEGKVVEIKDNDGNVVETCEWVSTKEPKDIVGLKTGVVYTLCETIAPDGYTIATEFQFTIAADGTVTCTGKTTTAEDGTTVLLVEDAPTKVYISKTDINSGDELPGATLQILDEEENVIVIKDNDGNPVETLEWVSGEEPKYIEGLPTGVNYILRETISPDGYTIASDTKFTIDEKGVVTSDGTTSTAEDGTTVLVVEDDLTTVQISKVDTESGKELEGAKLQIIDEDNNIVEEWTSTKEVHVVRGLVANKKYILRETVAPLGYTLTTDTTFSIDMHNVVTSTGPVNKDGVILVNDTMTEVEILKVDSKTGKGLAGAKLQVLDDNGAVCDEWKSTKDAHKIRGLYTGVKYTLHEVEAPKGYDKAKDITFTIDTAGKVSSDALDNGKIVMKDTPTPKKNKTGDEANGSLWALLLMMASGALGGTVWFKRRRRA